MLARDERGRLDDAGCEALLRSLGAREPSKAEEQAIKAIARGNASPGQERMAFKYMLELGGVANAMFDPTNERLTSFRLGSQAVAQTLAVIAGAAWCSFRSESDGAERDVSEEGRSRGS